MKQYIQLQELEKQSLVLDKSIALKKKETNKELKATYPLQFTWLKVFIIVIILSNITALFLTNMMVASKDDVRIVESNPITSETQNLEQHPEWQSKIIGFLLHIGFLAGLFVSYIWRRDMVTSEYGVRMNLYVYGSIAIIFLFDFINNLGYFIGGLM